MSDDILPPEAAAERNARLQTALKSATLTMAFAAEPETWPVFNAWLAQFDPDGLGFADFSPEFILGDMNTLIHLIESVQHVGRKMAESGNVAEVARILREKGLIGRDT